MHRRQFVALATASLSATAFFGVGLATAAATSAAAPRTAVAHSKPAWIGHAKRLGAASRSSRVRARVYLAPRGGEAALVAFATSVSTPGSARYRHFLTPAQYHRRFDARAATVADVSKFLRAAGLKVSKPASHNRYVTITGSVGAAEKAFATRLDRYRHAGRVVRAPSKSLKVPAALGSAVLAVSGLDTTPRRAAPASKQDAPPPAGFRNARPCSTYYGQLTATYQADFRTKLPKFHGKTLPYSPCGYTGPQFRSAYEGDTDLDGTGVTVGIVDAYAAPTIAKDANTYAENHGDGSYARGQLVQTVPRKFTHAGPDDCDASGWYGEETLDVEAVHAMAPGAKIHYYGGVSCYGDDLTDTLYTVVDQAKVQLVSNSYGDAGEGASTDEIVASENAFLQGASEGISFLFSSGDDGDELADIGLKQADYEASDPYVTGVGGTSTAIDATGSIAFQTGWGTQKYSLAANGKSWTPLGFLYGAGGGTSYLFNQPSYQSKVSSSPYRTVPDVAMDADPNTGMLIGETQTFSDGVKYDEYRIGGTSLASPLFAGMLALALQHGGGRGLGLLNPFLYKHTSVFTDVKGTPPDAGVVRADFANTENAADGVVYSVRTFNQDSSLKVTKGYDLVTGLGVPSPRFLTAVAAS